jgi:hypothetical protein
MQPLLALVQRENGDIFYHKYFLQIRRSVCPWQNFTVSYSSRVGSGFARKHKTNTVAYFSRSINGEKMFCSIDICCQGYKFFFFVTDF